MNKAKKLVSLLLLTAYAIPSSASDFIPPDELAASIKGGRYEPGQFTWMRGSFGDASPQEKVVYQHVTAWATRCLQEATTKLKRRLADLGYPNAKIEGTPIGPLLCRQIAVQPRLRDGAELRVFTQALARGTSTADGFLSAVTLAENVAKPAGASLSDALEARVLGEQMLRKAATWNPASANSALQLTEEERAIFLARLSVAMLLRDYENTEALKDFVSKAGWPRSSELGIRGAEAAWTLVQHSDHDPVFQLQVLQMMQPLIIKGEVSKVNYAYLHDRVSVKLAGRQLYGTQALCSKGVRVPEPLEDPKRVDVLRREVGLSSEADYLRLLDQQLGPCPAD